MKLFTRTRLAQAAAVLLAALSLSAAACGSDTGAPAAATEDAGEDTPDQDTDSADQSAKVTEEQNTEPSESSAADSGGTSPQKLPVTSDALPSCYRIDVPEVLQNPELPTGCESVALTMALMYEGFSLEKTTIADEYLIYSESGNLSEGYAGDPRSQNGAGCFPPTLVRTADSFLSAQQSELQGVDLTGVSLRDLFHYVAGDMPVIVWNTMYMWEPSFTGEEYTLNGVTYRWYSTEHCVVLSGYDLDSGIVYINDPLEGIVERDLSAFETYYDEIGRFAMVIQ